MSPFAQLNTYKTIYLRYYANHNYECQLTHASLCYGTQTSTEPLGECNSDCS